MDYFVPISPFEGCGLCGEDRRPCALLQSAEEQHLLGCSWVSLMPDGLSVLQQHLWSPFWTLCRPGCGHWDVHVQPQVGHLSLQLLFALESAALRAGSPSLCGCIRNVEVQGELELAQGLHQDYSIFQQEYRNGCNIFSSISQHDK